jgi:hypothetical protein
MPRRVDRPQDDLADVDLRAVDERLVLVRSLGVDVDPHGEPVLECEASMPGHMVGVRVRLEHADELDLVPLCSVEILLDGVGGIDDHRRARLLVADEVGGAPEILVDKLPEQHDDDASNRCGYRS